LKDKKATSAYGDDNQRDIEQYDATRRSEEAVRNMEDKTCKCNVRFRRDIGRGC
jgi:hypothetical protein